ncbi:MAG: LysR substrate-binding domain-containing protein [Pseudomonadota bacterium]
MISDISISKLRRLDLTLLLVFLGLLRHRKAVEVAADLGLTQSAISQALKRLREVFEDDLFLRRPHGMEPTATALALEAPVSEAVDALRGALGVARTFNPEIAKGLVRIAALHAEQVALIPPFFLKIRQAAPGLTLSVIPSGRREAIDALNEGRSDLALGFFRDLPAVISAERVYEDSYRVAMRPEVLPATGRIDLDSYCKADHILASPKGDMRGIVDDRLQAVGRDRRVVLSLPAFLPALAAVAASNALLTLPARVALTFADDFGLVTSEPPLDLPGFPVSVLWHRRNDADPRTQWIRSMLTAR